MKSARELAHELCKAIVPACAPVTDDGAWEHSRFCDATTAAITARDAEHAADRASRGTAFACATCPAMFLRLADLETHQGACASRGTALAESFLAWRNVDEPCDRCGGSGVRCYPSTAGWRGGAAGQQVTSDVCDLCWGSGDKNRHGVNLKRLLATTPFPGEMVRREDVVRWLEGERDHWGRLRDCAAADHDANGTLRRDVVMGVVNRLANKLRDGSWLRCLASIDTAAKDDP